MLTRVRAFVIYERSLQNERFLTIGALVGFITCRQNYRIIRKNMTNNGASDIPVTYRYGSFHVSWSWYCWRKRGHSTGTCTVSLPCAFAYGSAGAASLWTFFHKPANWSNINPTNELTQRETHTIIHLPRIWTVEPPHDWTCGSSTRPSSGMSSHKRCTVKWKIQILKFVPFEHMIMKMMIMMTVSPYTPTKFRVRRYL